MSGTSVDGIDAALVKIDRDGARLIASHEHPLPAPVVDEIHAISQPGANEIERLGPLDRQLGVLFAEAALALLERAKVSPAEVTAIGSHGQTVRHRPPSAGHSAQASFTLQIADPNTIAEVSGITTVADFRRRDIAADGEGAPLAPAFHAATMGCEDGNRAIINIGGIANATLLECRRLVKGFDTGPGNTLLDAWCRKHTGQSFDRGGNWSASGTVAPDLLARLLEHPYFALDGVRSTGKEHFNLAWLETCLAAFPALVPVDVQSTLCEFTATTIHAAVTDSGLAVDEIFLCGGGVHNADLLARLQTHFAPLPVTTTTTLGVDPDWVEAMAFAWLAARRMMQLTGNAPAVTGAAGERILGGIYPGLSDS